MPSAKKHLIFLQIVFYHSHHSIPVILKFPYFSRVFEVVGTKWWE